MSRDHSYIHLFMGTDQLYLLVHGYRFMGTDHSYIHLFMGTYTDHSCLVPCSFVHRYRSQLYLLVYGCTSSVIFTCSWEQTTVIFTWVQISYSYIHLFMGTDHTYIHLFMCMRSVYSLVH